MKKTIKKYIEVFQPKEYGMIDLVVKIGEEWNLSKEIFDKIYEKKFSTLIELNQKENKDIEQTLTTIFYNFSGGRDRKISKFKKMLVILAYQ
ncbi:hypothetical protein P5F71_08485 [Clostridium perfringens]|nr:hypothetical protein [Clostridium perfringens]